MDGFPLGPGAARKIFRSLDSLKTILFKKDDVHSVSLVFWEYEVVIGELLVQLGLPFTPRIASSTIDLTFNLRRSEVQH